MQPRSGPVAASAAAPSRVTHALDRTGVIASVGCAIHCMVAPLVILVAPTLGGFWVHPVTHLLIAGLVLPVAASALWRGFRVHRRRWIVALGGLGMALVIVGVILPWAAPSAPTASAEATGCETCQACCPTVERDAETGALLGLRIPPASVVTVLGGLALIIAHIGNLRGCGCSRRHGRDEAEASASDLASPES